MPQSLVLNLETQSLVPQQHLQGYSLQQLFFHLVDIVDPELGHVLRRDKQNRSYSLSAVQLGQPSGGVTKRTDDKIHVLASKMPARNLQYTHNASIAPKTSCWWRISFLDDGLFDHLIFLWNQLQDEVFQLGAGSVKIIHIAADAPGLSWASSRSYSDIYEQASAYERDIHFQFVTPTAFEIYGQKTALPTVEAVFQPLRKSWNRYGGLAFAPSLVGPIIPTNFNIQTQAVQSFRRRSLETLVGCVGQISFRILGDSDPLTVKRINTLADFTHYCPIGCNTQLGMGVVRRVVNTSTAWQKPHIS